MAVGQTTTCPRAAAGIGGRASSCQVGGSFPELLQHLVLPHTIDDLLFCLRPPAQVLNRKQVRNPAKIGIAPIEWLLNAAEAVLNEQPLRSLAPKKLDKGPDHLTFIGFHVPR